MSGFDQNGKRFLDSVEFTLSDRNESSGLRSEWQAIISDLRTTSDALPDRQALWLGAPVFP